MNDTELVIKIPTELYDLIQNKLDFNGDLKKEDIKTIMIAIDNGKQLPKGHGPLKDTDKIKASMVAYMSDKDKTHAAKLVMSVAKSMIDLEQPIIKADKVDKE